MRWGGPWGTSVFVLLALATCAMAMPAGMPVNGGPISAKTVTIRVGDGTDVTIWERTTDTNVLTYSVPTLTGPGGTYDSLANEHYTFTSDGTYLRIHCYRPGNNQGTGTGNNIMGVRLEGVSGYPSGIWASVIISYLVGYGGIESSRFDALGDDLSDFTFMGDQDSELVLAFTVESNAAPTIDSFTSTPAIEGSSVTFTVVASDADGDSLTYSFDFESDGVWDVSGPDSNVSHVFGDDFLGTARVRVDDGNASVEASTAVSVANIAPAIESFGSMTTEANVTLRVAGEKWHDVSLTVYQDGVAVGVASLVRMPGSPDDQAVTIPSLSFDLTVTMSAVVKYTPLDDPINGQVNGANPVWVIIASPEGPGVRIHHTFNVRHPETWTWTIGDLRPYVVGFPIRFDAHASDPGSDDLTFSWSWGDGSAETVRTYFNDGLAPDTYPSPDVNPISVTDIETHLFASRGTFTVTLAVSDDDGGTTTTSATVTL